MSAFKKAARMKRVAIFASGRGTNADNLMRAAARGKIAADMALLFSDNPAAGALAKARRWGVEAHCLVPKEFAGKDAYEQAVLKILEQRRVEVVALAGYMRIVGPVLLDAYPGRILNIHPALLPAFKGAHAIKDAYEYGAKVTGVTVHLVDEQVDHGAILLQKAVAIGPRDTLKSLEKKIHAAEYELYPKALNLILSGRYRLRGRKILSA